MGNFYLDEGRNIVQMHSPEVQAKNGNWFYGYVECNLRTGNWFILVYIEPTNDFSHCCEDCQHLLYGTGKSLKEAADKLRADKEYDLYPLFSAF